MNKLLHANFSRLVRDKIFWLCLAAMAAFSASGLFNCRANGITPLPGNVFTLPAVLVCVPLAVFCCLFVGVEYSDGTLRNKLCVGHSRSDIYLANLITVFAAALVMAAAFVAATAAVGIPLLGMPRVSLSALGLLALVVVAVLAAFAALYTALCMLISSRSAGAVASLLGIFGFLLASFSISQRLDEPEFFSAYVMEGGSTALQSVENTQYLRGTARAVYSFLNDFLPTGQAIQLGSASVQRPWVLIGYSALIAAVATAAGLYFFRRKDLK